jgi:3-hydroxymyristoyl/3-hydroxydecanoyl-(acyl carrier protein) dehydratase
MRFLLVDRITELQRGVHAHGIKAVTGSEDFFVDHFPGNPVMPGVLILEAMAQTAGALLAFSSDYGMFALMTLVEHAKFRTFVRPGTLLEMDVDVETMDAAMARVRARARVGDTTVAAAHLVFTFTPLDTIIGSLYLDGWKQLVGSWVNGADVQHAVVS